ncbi:MAG: hypothetical protein MRY21_07765 [Simkaniaceae bacterium]|nr:hypothetical protein [Simkaniaceae bacterium]
MKTAIVCAKGIGDGLLMRIVAHNIPDAVLFHPHGKLLSPLFPEAKFNEGTLDDYERIIIQNDNSKEAWDLMRGRDARMQFLFPKPCSQMREGDFLFDPKSTVVENLERFIGNRDNGIEIGRDLSHRANPRRVVIHPTSGDARKNWRPDQFLRLAKSLTGFEPVFVMAPEEKPQWAQLENAGFEIVTFPNLLELARFIHESGFFIGNDSGVGHLASNVQIPTLTISGNPKVARMWRPSWCRGSVSTLKWPLPNFKGIGWPFRDRHWQTFVPASRVLKDFKRLAHG